MKKILHLIVFLLFAVSAAAQDIPEPYRAVALKVEELTGFPAREGNSITWYRDGDAFLADYFRDLSAAKESVEAEIYQFRHGGAGSAIRDALIAKALQGVKVSLVVENISNPREPYTFYNALRKAGADLLFYTNPDGRLWEILKDVNNRTHRKLIVLDHTIGYTGGMNWVEVIRHREDIHFRVEGPVVADMHRLLVETRERLGGASCSGGSQLSACGSITAQLVPGGRADYPVMGTLYAEAFRSARKSLYIRTPYFCPSKEILSVLKDAAGRGVDVRLYVPDGSDWPLADGIGKSYYKELMEAGVHIFECRGFFNHAKIFIVDGYLGCAGTVNLDQRSLNINEEDCLFLYGSQALEYLQADFERIQQLATELTVPPRRWPHRYLFRVFSPWM